MGLGEHGKFGLLHPIRTFLREDALQVEFSFEPRSGEMATNMTSLSLKR